MKKLVSLLALFAIMFTMASCVFPSSKNSIDYGKKYYHSVRSDEQYYVFEKDQTGYCEYYYSYSDTTISGRVEFVWREASDGAIYLFRTNTIYHIDDNRGNIPLIDGPLYFSDEFFVYHSGEATVKFVKEGSNLKNLIKNQSVS